LLFDPDEPHKRHAISPDYNVLPGERALDEAGQCGLRLVHVYDLGHRSQYLSSISLAKLKPFWLP